jgi:DNA-binding IclR family transcriptional regulator
MDDNARVDITGSERAARAAGQGRVQLLDKAAALLDRLARDGELSGARLAEALGEPRSSVHRLLDGLRAVGYVEPGSRRGSYRLGLKLFRLGSSVPGRFDERAAARPVMERLHAQTEQTIFLTVRSGFEGVCIERVDGRWVQNMALQLGGSLPLHVGAGPRVLLAGADDAFVDAYLARGELERFTAHTITTADALWADVRATRAAGHAISDEDDVLGMAAVGAPIRDHDGHVTATVSLSGPKPTVLGQERRRSLALIAEAAAEISRALGYDQASAGPLAC